MKRLIQRAAIEINNLTNIQLPIQQKAPEGYEDFEDFINNSTKEEFEQYMSNYDETEFKNAMSNHIKNEMK